MSLSVNYNLEFRSTKDDAWYKCGVVSDHQTTHLRVKFMNLLHTSNDEVFSVSDFSTNHEIDIFRRRFRPESQPVECGQVCEGVMVSAVDKHLRYFDAIVDDVCYKEHTPEKCLCTYLLFWQHGPQEGNRTEANLDDIRLIKSGSVDPTVVKFTKLMKEKVKDKVKVKSASFEFTLIPKNLHKLKVTSSNDTVTTQQEIGSAGNSSHVGFSAEGEKVTNNYHYVILENLETDLCPLLMTDFIREQTLITSQAFVFPILLSNATYVRGVILVDDEAKLKKIYEFINNPNHLIVSSSGRPWVVVEDKLRNGTFNPNLHSVQPKYKNYNAKSDLKVVRLGTEEFTKAKQLKDLYLAFRSHLNVLLQRLAVEEEKNQGPLSVN